MQIQSESDSTKESGHKASTQATDKADKQGIIVSRLANDPDLKEVAEIFLANLAGQVEQLKQMLEQSQMEELSSLAHNLKGSGGSAGFNVISEKARAMEQAIKAQEIAKVQEAINEIEDILPRLSVSSDG